MVDEGTNAAGDVTRLLNLLAEDRPDPERLLGDLRTLREEEGTQAFAAALHLLAHLRVPEDLLRHAQVRET